jgi:hypothetical protein
MENAMPLIRLLYYSENLIGLVRRHSVIAELQAVSVQRNRESQVTGALLYDDDWFVQALEGEERAVGETLERIMRDPRHSNVEVVSRATISSRQFGKWAMGFAERTDETEAYFGKHWFSESMNPFGMSEAGMLELMDRLAKGGFMR